MLCCHFGRQVVALHGLSVLELCLLVTAQRLEDRGTTVFNFEVHRLLLHVLYAEGGRYVVSAEGGRCSSSSSNLLGHPTLHTCC